MSSGFIQGKIKPILFDRKKYWTFSVPISTKKTFNITKIIKADSTLAILKHISLKWNWVSILKKKEDGTAEYAIAFLKAVKMLGNLTAA